MKSSLIFLTLISNACYGQSDQAQSKAISNRPAICQTNNESEGVIKKITSKTEPNYFFRTFDYKGKEFVSFAGDEKLNLLDLNSNKSYSFKGEYDPVPLGSDFISVPNGHMHFYKVDEILKGNNAPDSIEVENDYVSMGVYQSVGKLKTNDGTQKYRLITDENGATAAEYEVTGDKLKMTVQPKIICRNFTIKLPMLSKDSTLISGFDTKSNTTKIWKINNNGTCDEILNLGFVAGKADFSYDNKKITFHTSNSENPIAYFDNASKQAGAMNVFVYNMERQTLKQMSHTDFSQNAYYPVFRPDDTIVYGMIERNKKPEFIHADPESVKSSTFKPQDLSSTVFAQLYAIGTMWSNLCLGGIPGAATAINIMSTMDPKKCDEFIDLYWDKLGPVVISHYKKIGYSTSGLEDKTFLHAACAKNWEAIPKLKIPEPKKAHPAVDILAKKCSVCHSNLSYESIMADPESIRLKSVKIMDRINSTGENRMPQRGALSDDEKKQISLFLNGKK
jgi:hypothetical protein